MFSPVGIANLGEIGKCDDGIYHPANGWLQAVGSNGNVNYSGEFYGQNFGLPIEQNYKNSTLGIKNFFGIKIWNYLDFYNNNSLGEERIFYLGFAQEVNIDYQPPFGD